MVIHKMRRIQCIHIFISILILLNVYAVSATTLGTVETNKNITLLQTCNNCTYCNVTSLVFPDRTIHSANWVMTKSGTLYSYILYAGNITTTGEYAYSYQCGNSGETSSGFVSFYANPYGENPSTASAILYVVLLGLLVAFVILSIFTFMRMENLLIRVGMLGLSYILFIAITFIGWEMAKGFLASSPFIADMLGTLFYILIIGAFPLLIGGFAFYLIKVTQIKEIQNLMNKGYSEDEAEERVKRRRR